ACDTDRGPLAVPVDTLGEGVAIAAAFKGVCVVEKSGRVVCVHGELDDQKPITARVLPGVTDAVEVSTHVSDVCIRRRSGKISCEADDRMVDVGSIGDATAIALSGAQLCAIRKDGTLWCAQRSWSDKARRFDAFVQVEGVRDAVELAVDQYTAC